MRTSGGLKYDEAHEAALEGGRGAFVGAVKWGFGAAILGGIGYAMSPIYRGLTIQFKVSVDSPQSKNALKIASFLQMSGMILGACLEADYRVREYEAKIRLHKRILRDRAVWEQYEQENEEPHTQKKS